MAEPTNIDFSTIEGPVYTGRHRGELLRESLKLDALDSEPSAISVVIPTTTYSISSSFFLGMFGPSVVRLGSKDAFLNKYRFTASDFLRQVIDGHILRALQERSLFFK